MNVPKKQFLVATTLAIVVALGLFAFFLAFRQGTVAMKTLDLFARNTNSTNASAGAANNEPGLSGTTFYDPALHFLFSVPPGFRASRLVTDAGETILIQSADAHKGVQVYITPFAQSGLSITPARVVQQAGLKIAHTVPITVANVAHGLSFEDVSSNPPLYESWFSYNGLLFQTSTWASDQSLLDVVLLSWQFD